jgi:hypothetical protein
MKQLLQSALLIALLAAVSIPKLMAQDSNNTKFEHVKNLLAATEQGMKSILPQTPDAVAENVRLLRRLPEFRTLESDMNDYWKPVVMNLPSIAPTETSQVILVQACSNITPGSYVHFLDEMATLYEERKISKMLFMRAIYPDSRLRYVLQDNYKNKDVVRFCEQAKRVLADEPQTINMFNAILSGQAKQVLDDMRKGGGETSPEVKIESGTTFSAGGTGSQ